MKTWEYKIIRSTDVESEKLFKSPTAEALEAHLNAHGAEGWEVVGVTFAGTMGADIAFTAIAKRERASG